jgi:hypothetical protein
VAEGKLPLGGALGVGVGAGESVGNSPVGDELGLGEVVGSMNDSDVGLSLGADVVSKIMLVKMGALLLPSWFLKKSFTSSTTKKSTCKSLQFDGSAVAL